MQLASLLTPDFCFRLLLTLAHFLWQGAAIALIGWVLLQIFRTASAQIRCHILTLAMLAMAAAPIVSFILLAPGSEKEFSQNAQPPSQAGSISSLAQPSAPQILPLVNPLPSAASSSPAPAGSSIDWRARLQHLSPILAILYFCIVLVLVARILLGLHASQRLCRDVHPVEPQIHSALARQMVLLRVNLQPALAYCTQITTPILVGILRPTVLLPLSLATNLSLPQIESILAHELAHIRRLDPILILVQRLIEALLFFHPLVWVISRRLDIERERACDQLVLKSGHNHLDYASALIQLAESVLKTNIPAPHLAATGQPSQLRLRILSLLGQPPRQTVRLTRRSSLMLLAIIIATCLLLPRLWAQDKPDNPATAPALLSKEQLLQRVTELRTRIKDLQVSTTDAVTKGPPNIVQNAHRTIVLKRDMIYLDQIYSSDKGPGFQTRISFDGQQTTTLGSLPGRAMISKGRDRQLDTQAFGFFTVNLLNPPLVPRSLLGLLQKTFYTIRKDVEIIDGHRCQVLEFSPFMDDTMHVWLDLDRGLLPIRHRLFRPGGKLWFECNVEKAVEIEKGLWFATRAKTTTFNVFKNMPEMGDSIDMVVIVDADRTGPLLRINQDPDDSVFDLAFHLPIGTQVATEDNREWHFVGFDKNKTPTTKPAAGNDARPPLTVIPVIAQERKVEFDLKPWGESVQGVKARIRLNKEYGTRIPMIDIENKGKLDLQLDHGRPGLEFDGKWYVRDKATSSLSRLPPTRSYNAIGPVSLDVQWFAEADKQPLKKSPGPHTIRIKYILTPVDGKGDPIEVITAPLEINFDAGGNPTTVPAH